MQVSLGETWAWIRQFCLWFMSPNIPNDYAKTGSQWVCRTEFDIGIVGPNPSVNTCSNTLNYSLERNFTSLWNECSLQHVHFFSNGRAFHSSSTCLLLCQIWIPLRMQCAVHIVSLKTLCDIYSDENLTATDWVYGKLSGNYYEGRPPK